MSISSTCDSTCEMITVLSEYMSDNGITEMPLDTLYPLLVRWNMERVYFARFSREEIKAAARWIHANNDTTVGMVEVGVN